MNTAPSLFDLYTRYDDAFRRLRELPRETVRAYWDEGRPAGQVADLLAEIAAINTQIAEHPEYRDFAADVKSAFGDRLLDVELAGLVYASLCNVSWTHQHGTRFSCSWRAAGDLVAELRNELGGLDEVYLDWYCGGGEGAVHPDVAEPMTAAGWTGTPAGT